jgi:type I restriction enzyme S subunit
MAGARVNQHVCILRATDSLLPRFLAYYMATPSQQAVVNSNQVGGTRQAVTKAMLLNWPVPLPAPKEQRWIVELLGQADGLRRQRAEADALADRILPALFLKMFGDPATNPKGWPVVTVGDMALRVTKGESPGWQGFQYQDEGPIFVTSENVLWGAIDLSEPKHIPIEFHRKLERSALRPKDVLINLVGASIGRSCIVPEDIGEANVNQAVAVITTCGRKLLPDYLGSLFLTPAAQARLHGGKVEAARANISLNDVRRFPVHLPPAALQERFVVLRQQTSNILWQREAAQNNIATLFEVMLHRAFTGELTSKWREAHLKELLAEMEQQARLLREKSSER